MTDGDHTDSPPLFTARDQKASLTLLAERQREGGRRILAIEKRLGELEKKQSDVTSLINRVTAGAAVLIALGVFVGWLIAIGGNIWKWTH
jgi:hypothetical protein